MKYRFLFGLGIFALVLFAALAPASAKTIDQSGTYIGTNVTVPADEEIKGDVTVIGGDAAVDGRIDGELTIIGGSLQRGPDAVITSVNQVGPDLAAYVPFAPSAAASNVARENRAFMAWLAYSAIVLIAFLIFPVRVRAALDRVEHHPGLSAAVGVLALVAIFPIALLLFVSFVGWPLIPVEFLAVFAAILIGHAALSMLIGRRLHEMILPRTTPSPLTALVLGLVIISAAGIIPVVGKLVMGLVWLVGLGAAILAFVRETAFMHPSARGPVGPRPPIGGPPMPAA